LKRWNLRPLYVEGMKGLGDNIYQRAFVKVLAQQRDVYLATPWPELYEDLPVRFVHMTTPLRTQAKNLRRQIREWTAKPANPQLIQPSYGGGLSIVQGMERRFGCAPVEFDLPRFENVIDAAKPICVVRPATVRNEWCAPARNPNPEYIAQAVEALRRDYFIVSVADLQEGAEIALEPLPYADLRLHAGELGVKQLLGLVQAASLVVGGVGWIVPACIAAKTPLFCILGGNGGYNAPEKITDPRMQLDHIGFARPDNYCMCDRMTHKCDKTISNLDEQLGAFLERTRPHRR
jgi:hypothetical protein